MLILYTRPGCPYCTRVISVLAAHGIVYEEKNILEPSVAEELLARGGKRQVPYLVDNEEGAEMYESEDIIRYLLAHYARGGTKAQG